ncbi:MAG: PHP domain-containing protein [Candidatus Levyibacteriota bacterium]
MDNKEIVKLFRNVAAAYAIQNEQKYKFQIIAYQKAADAVEHASSELKTLFESGKLKNIPGIGATITARLEELFQTGKVVHYEELFKDLSPAVFPLLDIPSFGPKKANKLVTHFKLKNPETVIEDIEKLATDGKIAELEGFGEKSQTDILRAIEEYRGGTTKTNRMVLPYAFELAEEAIVYLKKHQDVIEVEPLGSLRRMVSTVGDVDIAVTSKNPAAVIDYFAQYPAKERVIEKGPTTASILIGGGRHMDLLVLPPDQFGSLLQHFTGSKEHNVALREYALKKRFSLSERGIKLLDKNSKLVEFKTEEKFYAYLGLEWIPPEMRENTGEIELAIQHMLPRLIDIKDIKGDLHVHSAYPLDSSHDYGNATMDEMVGKAINMGYDYIGFSEHNPSVMNHTPQEVYDILKKRQEKIEQLKDSNKKNIRIINLLEIDILASGDLAIDDKSIDLIDGAIVSIHSSFSTPKSEMTKRVLKGLSHPRAKILAHPTGRLLNARSGYQLDWDNLFDFCKRQNKAIEINAWPERLDLPDQLVREAKDQGIKFVIDTDSHALSHMDNMFYGVSVARRGWCTKEDILNALPYEKFYKWLIS